MRHTRKTIPLIICLLLCIVLCSISASAADDRLGEIVDGSVLTEDLESKGIYQSLARGTFLSYGSGTIANNGNRSVSVSGETVCYVTCDEVKVTVLLQRLEGSSWVTVKTLGPKTAYKNYYVSASNTYSVAGGYYYRIKTSHVAIKGSSNEATASYTDGIWIP